VNFSVVRVATFFDRIYQKNNNILNHEIRDSVVKLAKMLPKGSSILDLGSGQGENAIYLAKKGMKVTCVDISKVGLLQAEERAKAMKLDIDFRFCDALGFKPMKKFDAVLSMFLTEYLDDLKNVNAHIELMKQWTKNGGYNIIASMVSDQRACESDFFFLIDNELLHFYSDWRIDDFNKGRMTYRLESRIPAYYNELFVQKTKVSNK
jgi:cyclopropane fatty-acyl-phospholipid synthase-like methyltransferase